MAEKRGPAGGRRLTCRECSYQAGRAAQLRAHMQSVHHQTAAGLACSKCNYQGLTPTDLKRHKRSEHAVVKLSCTYCSYR